MENTIPLHVKLQRLAIVSLFFQTNKHILSLDAVRVVISRQNWARVLRVRANQDHQKPIICINWFTSSQNRTIEYIEFVRSSHQQPYCFKKRICVKNVAALSRLLHTRF